MRVTLIRVMRGILRRSRSEAGFTLLFALLGLTVCTMTVAAVMWAVSADAGLTTDDLSGKQAYAAAQAGAQAYMFQLNDNASSSAWWQTCSNDYSNGNGTPIAVPGEAGESYSFTPVATKLATCNQNGAIGTVLDPDTGQLRIQFTGTSGSASRSLVVAFRSVSPLSYLYYSVHETWDPSLVGDPTCSRFYYQNPGPDANCDNTWGFRSSINGPIYTQDQLNINQGVTLGAKGDVIASDNPTNSVCVQKQCNGANIAGTMEPHANPVDLPSDNAQLEPDAKQYGNVLDGTTTLAIQGNMAVGATCITALICTPVSINLTNNPIIYDDNYVGKLAPACVTPTYDPDNVPNPSTVGLGGADQGFYYGSCGDVYLLNSAYSTGATIAATDDIIIEKDAVDLDHEGIASTGLPKGPAMLGLVADNYVRLANPTIAPNGQTLGCLDPDHTVDAAILALAHSLYADNTGCTNPVTPEGVFTLNGSLAQQYRGHYGVGAYLKSLNYDTRLQYEMPPYMFDLQEASWQVVRETLCSPTDDASNTASCSYDGDGGS